MMKKELVFSFLLCLCCTFFMGCKDDDNDNLLPIDDEWTAENKAKLAELDKDPEYQPLPALERPGSIMYYKVLEEGKGERKALFGEQVRVEYIGRLIDGEVFDSQLLEDGVIDKYFTINYTTFAGGVYGWVAILQNMKVGDRWDIWIPEDLAYGRTGSKDSNGNAKIPPYSTLNFEIHMLEIKEK
ncbi:MAG: FKBP-type peptidyl-prolyl cis-trans isomerase [Tannerellaceae bacterium]|nr:FKBP-type peptidyl-prolyl cis-trans isomerase [Tannerellaceae bacterium]